jgi:tetratricopeptide (TPR) repeat protein
VQGRAAAGAGRSEEASAAFAAALAAAPGNEAIAQEALAHAAAAGDWSLALAAARTLEQAGSLQGDGRFLLLADAVRRRAWADAGRQADAIEKEELFAFSAPVLRAWIALGARRGDPLSLLAAAEADGLAAAYAEEHRPLLLAALGRRGAAEALGAYADTAGGRRERLRIGGAGALLARRDRAGAAALLEGEGRALAAARARLAAGAGLPGAIDTPAAGIAEFLLRIGGELGAQDAAAFGLVFARIATWLAPGNSEAWLTTSDLLSSLGRHEAALRPVARVAADDPFAPDAFTRRIQLLLAASRADEARAEAAAAAAASGAGVADWVRLGDVEAALDRFGAAAEAYDRALALALAAPADGVEEWVIQLLRGGALHRAGRWDEALAALTRAHALAPNQPYVLNYLGYAQLERGENVAAASALVAEAHRLAPDNAAITDSLGWAYFLKGDLPRAIELLEQAAEGEPADVEINEHLGDAYFAAGRRTDARFAWRAALVHAEGADADRLRAKIENGPPAPAPGGVAGR